MLQTFPGGRSAMKGERSAMLQTFPLEEGLRCCRSSGWGGGGLQGGRSAIQHRHLEKSILDGSIYLGLFLKSDRNPLSGMQEKKEEI